MLRLVVIIFFFSLNKSLSQIDTSVQVQEIVVTQQINRNRSIGSVQVVIASDLSQLSIAEVLSESSNTYIKTYGAGSLSTTSVRGGSAVQSLVLWNGLPLQSPMLGLLDLSLIPSQEDTQISLIKGGNSSLWGSGAVSGLLTLESSIPKSNNVAATTKIGSFGTFGQTATIRFSGDKWSSRSLFSHESSKRDFTYTLSPNLPEVKQSNSSFHRNHFIQDIYFRPNQKHQLSAHIWGYKAHTEIPPTTVQNKSQAHQNDGAWRSILAWKYKGKNLVVNSKIGHFIDNNDYFDPLLMIESANNFSSSFADVSLQRQFTNHSMTIGSTYSNTIASSPGYEHSNSESRLGLFASHIYENSKIAVQTSLRQEFVDAYAAPFLPSVGATLILLQNLKLRGKVSKDFRLPTLNDRYWRPGGNTDLLPESGWSQEIGLDISTQMKSTTLHYSSTLFNRDVDNWIMWTPTEGQSFWSAQNINEVKSWGIEQSIKIEKRIASFHYLTDIQYSYINSTFQSSLATPSVTKGDQLLYTPRHQGRIKLQATFSKATIAYTHEITGSTTGINEQVNSSNIANVNLTYRAKINQLATTLQLSLGNVWNANYFIIERRPMPGRLYNLSINFKY